MIESLMILLQTTAVKILGKEAESMGEGQPYFLLIDIVYVNSDMILVRSLGTR